MIIEIDGNKFLPQTMKEYLIKEQAYNEGYQSGKKEGYLEGKSESNSGIGIGHLLGEAFDAGFLAAVQEMTECDCPDEYSEYEFGDVEHGRKKGGTERKHSHYFKDTSKFDEVDTYLLARIWNIVDENGALLHALKKILDAGKRGAGKDKLKDIGEARDSLVRYLEIEEMFQGGGR